MYMLYPNLSANSRSLKIDILEVFLCALDYSAFLYAMRNFLHFENYVRISTWVNLLKSNLV